MSQLCVNLTSWRNHHSTMQESREEELLVTNSENKAQTTGSAPSEDTVLNDRNSPECDLNYDLSPIDSPQSTQNAVSGAVVLALAESERQRQHQAVMEDDNHNETYNMKNVHNYSNGMYSAAYLQLPTTHERRSMTREGTPLSTVTVNIPNVPSALRNRWKKRGDDFLLAVISALYAKLLVVMGLAFPMSEVISIHVTSSSYLGFYLYLYFGSILYLFYVFISLVRDKAAQGSRFPCKYWIASIKRNKIVINDGKESPTDYIGPNEKMRGRAFSMDYPPTPPHHGSFYLRIGAVAFGVGSMIYSGLEFAQYFEVDGNGHCHDILMAITPAARVVFTFIQMYFIFLNAKMSICHSRRKAIAHFGLMHMIATNMCVWLNVIIEETKHEIIHSVLHGNSSHGYIPTTTTTTTTSASTLDAVAEALVDSSGDMHASHSNDEISGSLHDECRRSDVMGNLVQDASPFLFPCAIEYSLICAAILYVMWKNSVAGESAQRRNSTASSHARRSRHHYSVDCARANKGLFSGIFVLVLTIISLIVFFALINRPDYKAVAIMEVNMARLVLYCMAFFAVLVGIVQVRELRFESSRRVDLDDVLLIFGQCGVISYYIFTIIAAYFKMGPDDDSPLVLISALAALLQAITQTLFILDASRRNTYSTDQQRRKPGREVVTFLLVANFAMWAVNTLEKSRADVNPVQLQFYGKWPWIIITNVSMPLAIFYRFHSTVVLCEIWKRCYKAKPDYM